ncbi:MAG TPA: hypothetical protein PLU72_15845 [Candidatus Ozemobacteraceae bacterium]|nr:hypothetical protein [Candidatus Ozemobacteraceae bacterium]HQG27673.1 hypothetical protein [Candidatus Ozemobacteraceae bacterium]
MTPNDNPISAAIPAMVPKKCRELLAKLAQPVPEEHLEELREAMRLHLQSAERHLGPAPLNLPLIRRMTEALDTALNAYGSLSETQRALLVGAIRYFVENEDAANDLDDPFGFDDDLAVINAVLLEIGLSHLSVTR